VYQIDSNGDVDIPYIHRIHVEGLQPQEIIDLVRTRFIEAKILTDPSVIVRVESYQSKHLILLGQLVRPGRYGYNAGITLIQAVSVAGGFSGAAKTDRVTLTRKTKDGTRSVVVNAEAITEGRSEDIPLQAGDQIFVPQRVF
jgi:protein involved in polysaccharide export with SLBB domain